MKNLNKTSNSKQSFALLVALATIAGASSTFAQVNNPLNAATTDISALTERVLDLTAQINQFQVGQQISKASTAQLRSLSQVTSSSSSIIVGLKANPKILFVGNSYTYAAPGANRAESPYGMFMRMLKLQAPDAKADLSVIGGSVMRELWNWTGRSAVLNPKTRLMTGTYDLLVLQSGDGIVTSKTIPGEYELYADLFTNLAKNNGTDVMLYGVWAPDQSISISKGETVASAADARYKQTAARNTIGYAASGMAYTQAHRIFTELYGNGDDGQTAENMLTYDSVHAAAPAAYLAANMMYLGAFGVMPPNPSLFLPAGVTLIDAQILQEVALNAHNTHSILANDAWYK